MLDIVRARIGERRRITAAEMAAILDDLAAVGLHLDNGWGGPDAAGWAKMCKDITVISILTDTDAPEARNASSNPGSIRYDDPGSMHPMMYASLMFAPAALEDLVGQLRRRADVVLVVDDGRNTSLAAK